MRPFSILNDTHIGVLRAAGTTTVTSKKLRDKLLYELENTTDRVKTDLVINGDLFDGAQIPLSDALVALKILRNWLKRTGKRLILLPGNHDLQRDTSKLSTFQFISEILANESDVQYMPGGGWIDEAGGVYAISHVPNQDIFDYELSKVPECKYLLLHCNWNNGFANELDHSLNLSAEVAASIPAKHIILGHEHAPASHLNGKVVIPGNQYPSSIADCLSRSNKHYLEVDNEGIKFRKTWDAERYVELDWRNVYAADADFIRVVGIAEPHEATQALDTVINLRKVSEAFIVGGAIKIKDSDEALNMDAALASVEVVRAFDVEKALREILKPEQIAAVESLK